MTREMRRSTRPLIVLLLCAALSSFGSPAFADDKRRLAEKLLDLMGTKEALEAQLEQTRQMMSGQIEAILNGMGQSGDRAQNGKQLEDKVFAVLNDELSWTGMKEEYVDLYASTFSEDELHGLIQFYQSDIGRAFAAKQPQLMQKTMAMAQAKMTTLMPRLLAIIRGELGKMAPDTTPAPDNGASGT